MSVSATQLRQDLFRLLERVLDTGEPLEVQLKGRSLLVSAKEPPSKLARLTPRPDFVIGEAADLVDIEWAAEWDPEGAVAP